MIFGNNLDIQAGEKLILTSSGAAGPDWGIDIVSIGPVEIVCSDDNLTLTASGNGYNVDINSNGSINLTSVQFISLASTDNTFINSSSNIYIDALLGEIALSVNNLVAFNSNSEIRFTSSIVNMNISNTIDLNGSTVKVGNASGSIGLYGVTPTLQATTGISSATFVANDSGILTNNATWNGYTIGQVIKALQNIGVLT